MYLSLSGRVSHARLAALQRTCSANNWTERLGWVFSPQQSRTTAVSLVLLINDTGGRFITRQAQERPDLPANQPENDLNSAEICLNCTQFHRWAAPALNWSFNQLVSLTSCILVFPNSSQNLECARPQWGMLEDLETGDAGREREGERREQQGVLQQRNLWCGGVLIAQAQTDLPSKRSNSTD